MRETIQFHTSFLRDGHLYPSNARETFWWVQDSVTDLAALRATLPLVPERRCLLPTDSMRLFDEFPPTRFHKAEALYPIANKRTLASKRNPFNCENVACEPIYPWGVVGLHSEATELERMRAIFRARPFAEWKFDNAWDPSAIWAARLGLRDEVLRCFQQYVANVQLFPNGMPGTPGARPREWGGTFGDSPGLDASGTLATAVQEMLMQSYGGQVRLFPACPTGWEAEFRLQAEGGETVAARLTADGTICRL